MDKGDVDKGDGGVLGIKGTRDKAGYGIKGTEEFYEDNN
jgi:hypothetical protein